MTEPTEPVEQPAAIDAPMAAAPEPVTSSAAVAAPNRTRWLIAGGVVAAAVVATVGAVMLLAARPTPEALTYIPGDTAAVIELRMDLPGDQLQHVGNLLARFPGFKDQSTLTQKLSESIGKLVTRASNGTVDYATQVQPWLAGPLFAGIDVASGAKEPRIVIVATTDGSAECGAVLKGTTTSETVGTLALTLNADKSVGCLRDGRFGLLGDPDLIKAALDAHAKHTGMDTVGAYRTARDALGGDRLFTAYAGSRLYTELGDALASPGATTPGADLFGGLNLSGALAQAPAWQIVGLRAEDDALVMDAVIGPRSPAATGATPPAPQGSFLTAPPDHASRLAPLVPGDALALAEIHGVGVSLENGLTALHQYPQLAPALTQVDASLAALGGAHGLVGWAEDLGVVVVPDGTSASGGIIIQAADETTATAKVNQLLGFVRLASIGSAFDITETTIDGTRVTLIDLGKAGSLLGGTGIGAPSGAPSDAHLVIAVAARGPNVLIGGGEAFVRTIIGTAAGASLAEQAPYQALVKRTSAAASTQVYVAAGRIVALADGFLPAEQKGSFDSDILPYLQPFDIIFSSTFTQGDLVRSRLLITVK